MEKKTIVILVVVVLIAAIAFAYVSLVSSKTVDAQLNYESGKVLVNSKEITSDVDLKEKDAIETGADGRATVILYESIVISLEPNTKITLEDLKEQHPIVEQESGETWNTFTKIAGVEDYTIKSGNSVASVRGTAFVFNINKIRVLEGEVDYEIDGRKTILTKNMLMEKIGDEIVEREMTSEEVADMAQVKTRTIDQLKILREDEIEKHPIVMDVVKKTYDLTDEDIRTKLNDADEGRLDIDDVESKSPVEIESVAKVADITREIRKINQVTQNVSRL